jgi:hypothetical protein
VCTSQDLGTSVSCNACLRNARSVRRVCGALAAEGSVDTTIQGHGRLSRSCANYGQGSNRYEGLFHFKFLQG